ncbi:MAG: TonB-dependent receptor [Vicinamibacterales bacterium]
MKNFVSIGSVAALLVCLATTAFAQGGNALISGTVYDQAKALLPGATVVATNEATGIARETVTGPEGRFIIPTLTPGTYTVRAELEGFQSQSRPGLVLRIGQELAVDLTLTVATLAETVTVTGETPIVEATASRIGAVITDREIDGLPTGGRNHLSLMQLVPGMVPDLTPGEFEGGNFNVNGRATASNLWTVDGAANQDTDGGGTGPQARIAIDAMAEFQVLTHQYTAEFGGSSGVIVNAVTKAGSNRFSGRGFAYFEDESLRARDPFLDPDEEKPQAGKKTFGFNIGGPIVRNKAFFFFNLERNLIENAVVNTFPAEAAPIATAYADATYIRALSTYGRADYTAGPNTFSFRWQREVAPAVGEDFECCVTLDNRQIELDQNDRMFNVNWTTLLGTKATNELRFSHVGEDRVDGNFAYMGIDPSQWRSSGWIDGLKYVGLDGRDQFDIGSQNAYADFSTGLAAAHGGADSRNYTVQDAFTYVTGGGDHTFKAGFTYNRVMVSPQRLGANDNGTFTFRHNLPFNPANAFTYPSQFTITLGDTELDAEDTWTNGYIQDQWRLNQKLTLNLGVRYDYQDLTPQTKDAFAPRLGFAFDPGGDGRTVIRGGIGKFYEYHLIPTRVDLLRRGVFGLTYSFNTGEDTSADRGVIPAAHVCLQPTIANGLATISPACRAALSTLRSSLQPGAGAQFVNDEPVVDGDRKMGYLWGFSAGVKRELMRDLAVSVDYVGNRGRNQTGIIDINEGPVAANGRVTRLGASVFDPSGTIIPAGARNVAFRRVLQYQTRDDFNTDFNSLEVGLEKRYSNRWSARVAYTLAYANDVGPGSRTVRYTNDLNPRDDYGRANFDNRHAFVTSLTANPWRGLNAGAIVVYYSGYPINETIGSDVNGDRDNNDRPLQGRDDLTRPILSELDSNGRAVRNGIDGNSSTLLNLSLQYIVNIPRGQTAGFFCEILNALNKENLGNPTGNRNNRNFMVPVEAGAMRAVQLGVRYTF